MRTLLLVFLGAPFAWCNVCSSFTVDQITHNTIRVAFQNDESTNQARIQYGPTNSYGSIQGDVAAQTVAGGSTRIMTLTGIAPGTIYHFSAESFNGSAWCASVDHTATTLVDPGHPVFPIAPTTFTISSPATATGIIHAVSPLTCAGIYPSGFTPVTWGGTSCQNETDLRMAIRTSTSTATCNATYGDLILLNPGTVYQYSGAAQSTILTLCDAPDANAANHITSFTASTGVWTTASAHGLSVGNRVILGMGYISDSFGIQNDSLPLPFNAGYAYFVQSTPTSTTFTVSNNNGGALVTGLSGTDFSAPSYACWVSGTDVPAESEIIIRSATADALFPPFGTTVFTDANMNVINTGAYAIIRTGSLTSAAVRFDMGCLAHHYRLLGVKMDYAGVGSANELDGQSYSQFLTTSADNFHITLDRVWIHGADYPERDFKFCIYCDGHYIALMNSVVDGINFWTPSWSSTPFVLTSGTVITVPSGNFYFGNGVSDKIAASSGGTLTITAGGGVTGSAVFEATRSGFFLTVPTGVTATCVITGQTCTVSTAASPVYAQSGGLYTRVAIANPTITGGVWTAIGENQPPTLSLPSQAGSQEGAAVFAINKGPGPYLIKGNLFHNTPGIAFYFTADYEGYVSPLSSSCTMAGLTTCAWLNGPADLVFSQNQFVIDPSHLANEGNASWNGSFYSMRQHFEIKTGRRTQILGNIFSGVYCNNFSGRGVNIAFADRGGITITSSDHEVGYNTFKNACQGFQFVGGNTSAGSSSYPFDNPINSQRIWLHDNTLTGINRYTQATFNISQAPGDNGTYVTLNMGPQDTVLEHNFFDVNLGTSPSNNFVCNLVEGLTFRNNIVGYSNDDNLNDWWYSGCVRPGVPNPTGPTAATLMSIAAPNNFIWNHNVFLGGYSTSSNLTQMTSGAITAQNALWNSLPTTSFATGSTIAARAAFIGFTNYAAGNYALLPTSPYFNAGSDGKSYGPDYAAQCVSQGCVSGIAISSSTISFTAPDTFGCPVDVSTNNFSTWTRNANSGGSRSQNVVMAGLVLGTTYSYRIDCAAQEPTGSFTYSNTPGGGFIPGGVILSGGTVH